MIKKSLLSSICCLLLFVTGCDEVRDVQNYYYADSIGVDFKNGKYYVYVQLLDFTNIAKIEGATSKKAQVYVAKGVGSSFLDAMSKIPITSQRVLYFRHVTAIVLSKRAIQKVLIPVFDSISRNSELTLNYWVFGTNAPIENIFTITGFFNQNQYETLLHQPLRSFSQLSIIKPKKLYELGREISEPHYTTYLPSLSINDKQWKESRKIEPKLDYDGAFFLQNDHYKGFYKINQLKGLSWITKGTNRVNLKVPITKKPDVSVIVSPKVKYQEDKASHTPSLNVLIRGKGYIAERTTNEKGNLSEVEKGVSTEIEKEINSLYQLGLKKDIDFLNLEHTLYRGDYNSWKKIAGNLKLLNAIDVNIPIKTSSATKNQKLDIHKIE